ncbi:efflux RND transporter periplasmic adaptor subunit [Thiosocius teredinicola]|uniref:efflux RND transporter periplasmic adaptor subunit n=1 Tax=Thiosocius teredinicola TaxID=1973002 RepID=UPI000990D3F1
MSKTLMKAVLCLGALGVSVAASAADVTAKIAWSQRAELGTLVSGVISEVHVSPGQSVKQGAKLVSLDQRGFNSEVARRNAEVSHTQALLQEAKRDDDRAIELYDRTVLSDFERNQAAVALKSARASAEAARAALVAAKLDLERSVVTAPFDAMVLAVNAVPGESVVSELQSRPLVTVADNRRYHATAVVDADTAARLQPGQALKATVRGETRDAKVAFVGFEPVGDAAAAAPGYELVAEIGADPEQPLRVGESVTLHLE